MKNEINLFDVHNNLNKIRRKMIYEFYTDFLYRQEISSWGAGDIEDLPTYKEIKETDEDEINKINLKYDKIIFNIATVIFDENNFQLRENISKSKSKELECLLKFCKEFIKNY